MNSKKILFALLITCALVIATISTQAQGAPFSKEINQEVPSQKGSLIRIVTGSPKISVKSWDQAKVKVTIDFEYSDSAAQKRQDADWFEYLGINIKPFTNRVDILTSAAGNFRGMSSDMKPRPGMGLKGEFNYDYPKEGMKQIKKGPGDRLKEETAKSYGRSMVRSITIMVCAGCKLDLDNKYGDVSIAMNLDEAKLKINNGALDAQDIKDLQLTGSYCNANLGNIDKAEIELSNGTLRAQNITNLDLDAKSSTFEYEKGTYLYLRSQGDNITIASIDKIDGRKVYGSLKIDQLNGSFDLEGNNVDIKFRDISPEATLIRINDRYGDLRLPVKSLKNYYVDFIGNYSTVFAPFQKEVVKDEEKKEGDATATGTKDGKGTSTMYDDDRRFNKEAVSRAGGLGEVAPRHFTSTVGDTKGKHTRIELTCHSCTVDFK